MKNNNIIVRIPEPCHEDWNKMTPDNKGRFCGSCQKSVYDFTNKTDDEIKDILMQNQGQKLCGHFKKSQIDRPLNIRVNVNELPHNMSMTKIFAFALLLTFGTTLFGCYDLQGKKINAIEMFPGKNEKPEVLGEIAPTPQVEKTDPIKKDSLVNGQCESMVDGEMHVEQYVAGGIGMEMIQPIMDSVYTVKVLEKDSVYEVRTRGEVVPEVELKDTIEHKDETKQDSVTTIPVFFDDGNEKRILGGPIAVETVTEEVTEPQNNSTGVDEINKTIKESSFAVFPNPGKGDFTIKYEVIRRSEVRVDILDAQGKLIANISDIAKQYEGRYEIPVSLDVPNGIYIVSLVADGKKSTSRIVIER